MEVSLPFTPENPTETPTIHFEPGSHPRTDSDNTAVYNSFYSGNLDAHGWNKEVGERIASYAFNTPALLLTIDGVGPQSPSAYPVFTPLAEAAGIWTHLPARPNQLNHTGKLYVVKADTDYYRLPQAILPNVQESNSLKQQMDADYRGDIASSVNTLQASLLGETALVGSLGAVLWGASKLISQRAANQKISRRQFLNKSLAIGTGIAIGTSVSRAFLGNLAAIAPNEPTAEFLETVDNTIRSRLIRSSFIDGRTGLLLAKAEDAQQAMESNATNVIVLGEAHADIAATFMQEKGERNTAIAAYAQELLAVAQQVYDNYYHLSPDHIPSSVTHALLNYVSQVDIVEIRDPGGQSYQPNFPSTVDKQITPYKSFHSPQVEEAISQLRP